MLFSTYRSMFVKIRSCNEAIEVGGGADVGVDVGVVHAHEEVGDRVRRRDLREIGQLVAVRPNQAGRVHCKRRNKDFFTVP